MAMCLLVGCLIADHHALGQESESGRPSSEEKSHKMAIEIPSRLPIPLKTMGGRQFWGDCVFFRGWRIQHNVVLNVHRLLDPHDAMQAIGSLSDCRQELERFKQEQNLSPMSGRAIVFVHGIGRSSKSFAAMKKAYESDGDIACSFDYPSTRLEIEGSAGYLRDVITSLDGVEEINIVAQSLGGLLVRSYLSQDVDPRIRRFVMLGTPNRGAELARRLKNNGLFKFVLGDAGQQLALDEGKLLEDFPIPKVEFAIIAGARGKPHGWNPLIPGDDDGTVSVTSTRLPGCADFMTVPVLHSFLMGSPTVIESCQRFFNTGALRESGEKHPIPGEEGMP